MPPGATPRRLQCPVEIADESKVNLNYLHTELHDV